MMRLIFIIVLFFFFIKSYFISLNHYPNFLYFLTTKGQIKRFKDDVKIEEELLEIFNRKVDKVKQNLDEDQEKLVKDEKVFIFFLTI